MIQLKDYTTQRDAIVYDCRKELLSILSSIKDIRIDGCIQNGSVILDDTLCCAFINGHANVFEVGIGAVGLREDKIVLIEDLTDYDREDAEFKGGEEFDAASLFVPSDLLDIHEAVATRIEDLLPGYPGLAELFSERTPVDFESL